jgi:hypothetical protein
LANHRNAKALPFVRRDLIRGKLYLAAPTTFGGPGLDGAMSTLTHVPKPVLIFTFLYSLRRRYEWQEPRGLVRSTHVFAHTHASGGRLWPSGGGRVNASNPQHQISYSLFFLPRSYWETASNAWPLECHARDFNMENSQTYARYMIK